MNRLANALVRAAPANLPVHSGVDVRVGWLWRLGQQCRRGHDLPTLAIAALRHLFGDPGFLNRVQLARRQPFYSSDAAVSGRADRHLARPRVLAVDVNGAGGALSDAAAVLGAGE